MRILYVTSAELGRPYAPASRAKGLSAALAKRGMSVHLLGTEPASDFTYPGVTVRHIRKPAIPKVGAVVWHSDLLRHLASAGQFDLVLLRETPRTFETALYARMRRLPLVLEVNAIAPEGKAGFARFCYAYNYRAANRIIVLTEALGEHLRTNFSVEPEKIRVIPNAADTDRFHPRPREAGRPFTIVYMGSYHDQQGVDVVIPLAQKVDAVFVMTGHGESLRAKVDQAGLASRFRFVGPIPDDQIGACVAAADAALSPINPAEAWRTEVTFPQKVVEYLACGTPVLAMGHSPAQRAILEGCGRLVEPGPGHIEEMAQILNDWKSDAELRGQLGRAAVERIRTRFSYDAIAAEFESLFRSL